MGEKQQKKWYKLFVLLGIGIILASQLVNGPAMVFAETKTSESEAVSTSELATVKDLPVSTTATEETTNKKPEQAETQQTTENQPAQSSENIPKVATQADDEPLEKWMPDENLRKAVAKGLKITESELTKEAVADLTSLTFDRSGLEIEKGQVVSLKGLEYVKGFSGLDTTYIVPINIPNLRIKAGALVTVRPDVLIHLTAENRVNQLNVGSYNDKAGDDRLVTTADLNNSNVINAINQLNPTDFLRIYSKDMTDFSLLKLNVDTKNGQFYNFDNNINNPIELPPIKIVDGSEEFVYSQGDDPGDVPTRLKGTTGQPLVSGAEPRATRAFIQFLKADKELMGYFFETRWTEKGFIISYLPEETAFIRVNFNIGQRAFTNGIAYSIVADIPIERFTPAADVTVKYLNEEDKEVQSSKPISGYVGGQYDATTSDYKFNTIDDYVLDETQLPDNAKGYFSETPQEVIYRYKKKTAADVTVNYLDENDQPIRSSQTIRGALKASYDATTPKYKLTKIGDYILDESRLPLNAIGDFDEFAKTVNYYYKKTATPASNTITVKYVDKNSKEEIRQAKKISRKSGEGYDATTSQYKIQQINQYTLDEENLPTNAKGTCNGQDITVVYQYKTTTTTPDPDTGRVTVKYLNDDEEEIYPAKSFSGELGTRYDVSTTAYKLTKIDDYYLNQAKLPDNAVGTFTATNQVVKYYYKKATPVPEISRVIVKYEDEAGKEIREPQVLSGKIGEAYDATTDQYKLPTIDDYYLNETKLPNNGQGTFGAQAQVVTYVYQKNSKTPTPVTNYLTPTGRNYTYNAPNSPKSLPNTGENHFLANIFVVIGGLMILLSAMIVFKKKRVN